MKSKVKILSIVLTISIIILIVLSIICISLVANNSNDEKDNEIVEKEDNEANENKEENEENSNNGTEEPPQEIIVEELDINTKEVSDLYGLVRLDDFSDYNYTSSISFYFSDIMSYVCTREKTVPSDFNEWGGFDYYLVNYLDILNYIKRDDVFNYTNKDNYGTTIKKSNLEEALYKIFGNSYSTKDFPTKDFGFKYLPESDSYHVYLHGGSTYVQHVETKLIKAEKKTRLHLFI